MFSNSVKTSNNLPLSAPDPGYRTDKQIGIMI